MVDTKNPTSQFHPYQPETSIPQAEAVPGGLGGMLKKVGIDPSSIGSIGSSMKNMNMDKVRGMAQRNPGAVLGGLAALAIGMGMLRRR